MKKIFTILLIACTITSFAADPTAGAKKPTFDAADVISLFSDAYTDVTVDTWRTGWSNATLTDTTIGGDAMKRYSKLDFVGTETVANKLDITGMNFIHVDVWTGDATTFRVKLVDFGADGNHGGGDDTEHEVAFTNPAQNEWISHHIDLKDFVNLKGRKNIAQMIFSALPTGTATVYIDNVYYTTKAMTAPLAEPKVAAAQPTRKAADVISLFSDTFTNVTVDSWRTGWSSGTLTEMDINGNNIKKYSALDFVGIETVGGNLVDATAMEHVNIDVWSPNSTKFKIKIVDFGADGMYQGGDDTEHELVFESAALDTWVTYHIPFSDFTGLSARAHLSQYILVSEPTGTSVVYIDNFYFSKEPGASISRSAFDQVQIFPNPSSEVLNVNVVSNNYEIKSVRLTNLMGQEVFTSDINGFNVSESINTSGFAKGVYTLSISTTVGTMTEKVIIK